MDWGKGWSIRIEQGGQPRNGGDRPIKCARQFKPLPVNDERATTLNDGEAVLRCGVSKPPTVLPKLPISVPCAAAACAVDAVHDSSGGIVALTDGHEETERVTPRRLGVRREHLCLVLTGVRQARTDGRTVAYWSQITEFWAGAPSCNGTAFSNVTSAKGWSGFAHPSV